MKPEEQLKALKNSRARKLGTLTRARRRAFIIIEAKGSRTQLGEILKELDVTLDAVQEVHDKYVDLLTEEDEIKGAETYIEEVEKQHSDAVERIREHLEARKDEAPSVVSGASNITGKSRSSASSEATQAREAEIKERLKQEEMKRTKQRLEIEAQEQELGRRRKLLEAADALEMAKLEAKLKRAALDDLQWERRDDFDEIPPPEDTSSQKKDDAASQNEDDRVPKPEQTVTSQHSQHCSVFSKSLPKVKLPQFSGNSLEWPQWFGLFQALVDSQVSLSKTEKMVHLQTSVTGVAQKSIAGFMYNPDLYDQALAVLKERFGREKDVVRAHLNAMFNAPRPSAFSASALEDFHATVNCTVAVLKSLHYEGDLHSHENLQRVVEKLPPDLRREWSRHEIEHETESGTLSLISFCTWLGGQAKIAMNCVSSSATAERRPTTKRATLLTVGDGLEVCVCCGEVHHLTECKTFLSWSVDARAQFVASQGLCFVCLQRGHHIRNCSYARPCGRNGCVMQHHELLHGSKRVVRRWTSDRSHQLGELHLQKVVSNRYGWTARCSAQSPLRPFLAQKTV